MCELLNPDPDAVCAANRHRHPDCLGRDVAAVGGHGPRRVEGEWRCCPHFRAGWVCDSTSN